MVKQMRMFIAMAAALSLAVGSLAAYGPDATPLDEQGLESLTKAVYPAVVKVEVRNGMKRVATGIVVDKEGYILTTALVTPRDEEVTVVTADGKRLKAEFLGFDLQTRIAVLKAKDKLEAVITPAKAQAVGPGTWIAVVSISPEGTPALTQGIVSSSGQDRLRLNVWVVPGSSGSPVVNKDGQMVGLLRGAYTEENPVLFEFREREAVGSGYVFSRAESQASGMAAAVPVEIALDVFNEIKDKGKVARGWLGVNVVENKDGRIEIVNVEDESPASLAKLKEGDIILKLDGKAITSPDVLSSEVRKRKPGKDVAVQVERDGKSLEVKVKVGEYSEKDAWQELQTTFPRLFPNVPFGPTTPAPPYAPKATPQKPQKDIAPAPKQPTVPYFQRLTGKRQFIGVFTNETTKELAEYFGLKDGVGLLITRFSEDSPAQKAGLKVGDVIVKADGKRVESVAELSEVIQDKTKGDKVKIEFLREKKSMTLEVEVAEEQTSGFFFAKGTAPQALDVYSRALDSSQRTLSKYDEEMQRKTQKMSEELLRQRQEMIGRAAKDQEKLAKELAKKTRIISGRVYRI